MARISSRLAAASGSVTPPGTTQPGWMRLLPSSSMMCCPKRRRPMPARPSSGLAAATPRMLRSLGIGLHAQQQVGRGEIEEAQRVRLHHLRQVQHAPQLRGGVRNAHRHDGFAGLGRGDQVRNRADAADARHQAGHLVERPALGEALKAAHLGDVEMRVLHFALVVELDGDLAVAFQARYWIDGDGLAHRTPAQAPKRVRAGISSGSPVTSAVSAV